MKSVCQDRYNSHEMLVDLSKQRTRFEIIEFVQNSSIDNDVIAIIIFSVIYEVIEISKAGLSLNIRLSSCHLTIFIWYFLVF